VRYGRLVDAGRSLLEQRYPRSFTARAKRGLIRFSLGQTAVFGMALKLGRAVKGLLPSSLAASVPDRRVEGVWPPARHTRRMIVLGGCVQPALDPATNAATARILDHLGISLVQVARAGCCGALPHHTGDHDGALDAMRRNIDAWWPLVEAGAEAIIATASGCGSELKEYGHQLRHDLDYADRAAKISERVKDLSEILEPLKEQILHSIPLVRRPVGKAARITYHPPCSLQHGQQIRGKAEAILSACGFELQPFSESHLCCGSAGSYSLLQAELSQQLKTRKLGHILGTSPTQIATSNIGCQMHLQSGTAVPVRHWITLVDDLMHGKN